MNVFSSFIRQSLLVRKNLLIKRNKGLHWWIVKPAFFDQEADLVRNLFVDGDHGHLLERLVAGFGRAKMDIVTFV